MNAWTLDRRRKVDALFKGGKSPSEIATVMKVTTQSINSLIGQRRKFYGHDVPPMIDDSHVAIERAKARAAELERRRQLAPAGVAAVGYMAGLDTLLERRNGTGPIPLTKLTSRTCRWPLTGNGADTLFCGDATVGSSSWCACHRAKAIDPRGI